MKSISIAAVLVLFAGIITTVLLAGQQQDVRSRASETVPSVLPTGITRLTITSVAVTNAGRGAMKISWRTIVPSTGLVEYGESRDMLDQMRNDNPVFRTDHEVVMPLKRIPRYYFRIRAHGQNGEEVISDIYNFKPS